METNEVYFSSYASQAHNGQGAVMVGYNPQNGYAINVSTYGISAERAKRIESAIAELLTLPVGTAIRFHRNLHIEADVRLY